ncbi:MAG: SusD/RagB family nutrient-binding outer membrane lipoprotein [Flavobacteriaceae bacterium]
MKKIITYSLLFFSILMSCEVTDFNLQDNPNALTPLSANPDYVLNEIQIKFSEAMGEFIENTDRIMRYKTMNGTYSEMASADALEDAWSDVYEISQNVVIIEEYVENNPDFTFHRGIARLLQAYAMATLVDYLGDIPYSEANNPAIFNPVADDDEAIYTNLLESIDLAITDVNNAEVSPLTDLYYGADKTAWIKLANSLKLKMYINTGNQTAVSALISTNNLINSTDTDFEFKYSTATAPDSRHPFYSSASYGAEDFSSYIGNNFMWMLKDSKSIKDPRLRYYLYRQTNVNPQDDTSGNYLRCEGDPSFDYCYVGDYYWGRDHGDNGSRPADGFKKTTYGVYPIGGAFDEDNAVPANETSNMGGAGIAPILLSSYVYFLKAEAVLSLGVSGDAWAYIESGIRESMAKVLGFNAATASSSYAATTTDIDSYVSIVSTEFNAASDSGKLDIVMREYYLSGFGNAIEAYNAYRRTGYPSDLQVPIKNKDVPFPRTFLLPSHAVNSNASLNQRATTNQVFWDTNPAGFIQ